MITGIIGGIITILVMVLPEILKRWDDATIKHARIQDALVREDIDALRRLLANGQQPGVPPKPLSS